LSLTNKIKQIQLILQLRVCFCFVCGSLDRFQPLKNEIMKEIF